MIFSLVSLVFSVYLSAFHSAEFLREEVVVLLTAQFITLFNQTALEVRAATVEIHQPEFPSISYNVTLFYPEFHPNRINLSLTWKDLCCYFEKIIKYRLTLRVKLMYRVHIISLYVPDMKNEEALSPLIRLWWLSRHTVLTWII